jgi:hypothetical protein
MNEDHDEASTGVENISSSSSNEIAFENANPIVTAEEDSTGPESVLSGKDDIEKDPCNAGTVTSAWIPTAEEEDHGSSSGVAYTQSLQLLPPSIDSLVAAKAAIAAQSRPTESTISQHGAEERRHSSLAKRQARREYILAASSNGETSLPQNSTENDNAAALPEEGMLLPTISAEIVGESPDGATERERFIQEANERVAAEVIPADLVHVSQHLDSNEIAQLESPKRPLWYRYCAACFILIVIGTVVGVIVSRSRKRSSDLPAVAPTMASIAAPISDAPSMAPSLILSNGKHAFTATAQLYDAVDAYEAALQDFGSAENSDVAEMYGYPMGT